MSPGAGDELSRDVVCGKARLNRIGATTRRLIGVNGRVLEVSGLDAIDGTPVIDIEPHLEEFAPRAEVRQPVWSRGLMRRDWP